MSMKSSRSLLQGGVDALQSASRRTSLQQTQQHRAFSQSSRRLRFGPIPKFTNLSNPELEVLLNNVREKIILPAHLTELQRKLIFQSRNKKELLIDPIKITVSGEDFTLKPLNRVSDIPSATASLYKAIRLMETSEDFDNVPRLLEGLKNVKANLDILAAEKVTKMLGQKGQQHHILECARRGQRVGFDLTDDAVVRQILYFFHDKAIKADFEAGATKKALAWSEQLLELLELPENRPKGAVEIDPRRQPVNIGVLLSLAAMRAKNVYDGKDTDGKVEVYAKRLVATGMDVAEPKGTAEVSLWLGRSFPLVYGMKNALEVLDASSPTAVQLKEGQAKVQAKADQYLTQYNEMQTTSEKKRSSSALLYDNFLKSS